MLKRFLMVLVLTLFAGNAWAAHLVCDMPIPTDNVTSCEVEIDGTIYPGSCLTTTSAPNVCGDGSCYELIDLDPFNLAPGQHQFRARFINIFGPGDWSDPYNAGPPGAPGNVRAK